MVTLPRGGSWAELFMSAFTAIHNDGPSNSDIHLITGISIRLHVEIVDNCWFLLVRVSYIIDSAPPNSAIAMYRPSGCRADTSIV
jgi:hypothetical protein